MMPGNRIQMAPPPGFNPPRGTVIMNGLANIPVAVPTITANALIFVSILQLNGTIGVVLVSSITPGVGFTLTTIALNSSKVAWLVLEP